MPSVWNRLEPHLGRVRTPSQYIGGERHSIRKEWDSCDLRFLFAFPDTYSVGMSHLGLHILYHRLNREARVLCERAFAPWTDLEAVLRREAIPLFSLESHRPAREFDIVGFSLQSEMTYTNVLNMLDLAGIPMRWADRGEGDPLVIGGGPNASFPEPLADFFDAFLVGDGEETLPEFVRLYREFKRAGRSKETFLREAVNRIPGTYVPRFYEFRFEGDGIRAVRPLEGVPPVVTKAVVANFREAFFPLRPIVPYSEVIFGRINLEIMRGCPHRCRFCHAVSFKNRLRFRTAKQIVEAAEALYANTGHDEISLISLSSGDHPEIHEILMELNRRFRDRRVTISLPSLRIDRGLRELPALMKGGRRSGMTLAPEGGTEAFRRIIRKPIKDEDLFATAEAAFREGFTHLKLYFMVGLPRERPGDVDGIVDTAVECARIGRRVRGRRTEINVTISPFVPKPFTPFQFAGYRELEYHRGVRRRLLRRARGRPVRLKFHDPESNYIQAALARGDRRLGRVLMEAWKLGARFDEWRESFVFHRWLEAFRRAGLDPDRYARREYGPQDVLPWDVIDIGTSKKYFWNEFRYFHEQADQRETSAAEAA